ncbi:MAG: hypothetical protein KAQ68_05615 [Clostridiales bacterium]|nr:hypothetical protein [Clostridiales bacterium]
MIKKIVFVILSVLLVLSLASCQSKFANVLFDDLGYSVDNTQQWSIEIKYISDTRGTSDDIYKRINHNPDDSTELIKFINIFYGAQRNEAPDIFAFSAEAMSDYMFEFYLEGVQTPVLSFYYWKEGNLLTRIIHRYNDKDQKEYLDYEFYTPYFNLETLAPYTDLSAIAEMHKQTAHFPNKKTTSISLNQKQLIASVLPEELEERMTYQDDEYEPGTDLQEGEIEFEFYSGELPSDEGTACKMYDNEDIAVLTDDQIVLMAKTTSETGEPLDLNITFLEYNMNYTIVSVSYPNIELMESMKLETANAIIVDRELIDPDKYIVFVDDAGKVVHVVVPFIG